MKLKPIRRFKFLSFFFLVTLILATVVLAAGSGTNQWPGGRIAYRLDTHFGQVAANAPAIPLYNDAACTQPISHYLLPGDWVIAYFNGGNFSGAVTYPITVPQNGGGDDGLEYTTHYIHPGDLSFIVSGTGNFSGTDWNQTTWFNHLPTNIGYTSKLPGNGDTVWVGNNSDGGAPGGFNVASAGNGYYRLFSGDYSSTVMSATLSQYCFYDSSHSDYVNADYSWNLTSQPWNTNGLHQGYNLISYAGMDASGNYATGQRYLWWDTLAPDMDTNFPAIQNSPGHSGWLNLADFNSDQNVVVLSHDNTSQTTDVSGLNPASLRTDFDGVNCWGDGAGYQGFDTFSANSGTKNYSLKSIMQAMGVRDDGTGGQGTHSFAFSSIDNAWNTAVIGNSVQIDTVPPTCTASVAASDWHTGATPITLNFADATSGVATEQYSWSQSQTDAGTWQDYTTGQQLSPPGNGSWYLHWQATDVAGNSSSGVFGPYSTQAGLTVQIVTPNAGYITDSDVVTSVNVIDNSSTPVLPGDNAVMTFTVKNPDGSVYTAQTKPVVCPANQTNLVWFKWHTSKTAGKYTLTANVTTSSAAPQPTWTSSLMWNISDPYENTPPNPGGHDRMPQGFTVSAPPSRASMPNTSWSIWDYIDGAFQQTTYHAALTASLAIAPDPNSPTAFFSAGSWTIRSGYGIAEKENASMSSDESDAITTVQSASSYYPEFNYETYNRNMQQTSAGIFELAPNIYSFFQSRVHFTPVDFPDGPYTVQSYAYNAWSPAGMLSAYSTDTANVQGDVFDDWYTHPGD